MKRGLPWYKHDPIRFIDGVQGLGADTIGAYVVLIDLIYARGGETRRDDRHLAGILGCSKRLACALTDRLIAAGKIEIRGENITQKRAETDANAQRMLSETRANAGRMGGEKSGEVRKNKALVEAIGSEANEADKDKEEDKKEREAKASQKKGTRLPAEWFLPWDWEAWALGAGWDQETVRIEGEKFRDYWHSKAGSGATKLDWQATWRNWMRNTKGATNGNGKQHGQRTLNIIEAAVRGSKGAEDYGDEDRGDPKHLLARH
jgi:uncharacterized protein YdaU (DUF1376 family)